MKAVPFVVPAGCTLSPGGFAAQKVRAELLRSAVHRLDRTSDGFRVCFRPSVDSELVAEVVATERECCSFLDIQYDRRRRVLSVGSSDKEAVAALASFFGGGRER